MDSLAGRYVDALRCIRQGRNIDRDTLEAITRSKWFDGSFYSDQSGCPVWVRPEVHYLVVGAQRGWAPSAGFDATAYRQGNPDVAASGIPALVHFVLFGESEGRQVATTFGSRTISLTPSGDWPTYFEMPTGQPFANPRGLPNEPSELEGGAT